MNVSIPFCAQKIVHSPIFDEAIMLYAICNDWCNTYVHIIRNAYNVCAGEVDAKNMK